MTFFSFGAGGPLSGLGGHGPLAPDVFRKQFAAYTGAFSEQGVRVNNGGRVLLPATCLAEMATMNLAYPLQFQITSLHGSVCYAGVLEFVAEQGTIILPDWMFSMLMLEPGDVVKLQTVALPSGGLISLRPQQRKFIELSNPKLVLEQHLVNYPVITKGSSIVINYIGHDFIIDVTEVLNESGESVPAISTVRADAQATELKVEFERPLDMPPSPEEKEVAPPALFGSNIIGGGAGVINFKPLEFKPPSLSGGTKPPDAAPAATQPSFHAFSGCGRVLSGKPAPSPPGPTATGVPAPPASTAGAPLGGGNGGTSPQPETTGAANAESINEERFKAFSGAGRSLR